VLFTAHVPTAAQEAWRMKSRRVDGFRYFSESIGA
jgi:hypothetical protein